LKKIKQEPLNYFCDTYKTNFIFCVGMPEKQFLKYAKDTFNYERDLLGDGLCLEIGGDYVEFYVIWVRKRNMFPELAHECLHAAMYLFDNKGIKYDGDNSEQLAYFVEKLTRVGIGKD